MSLSYLLSSLVRRQGDNGFSYQDPDFINHVVNKNSEIIRGYLVRQECRESAQTATIENRVRPSSSCPAGVPQFGTYRAMPGGTPLYASASRLHGPRCYEIAHQLRLEQPSKDRARRSQFPKVS